VRLPDKNARWIFHRAYALLIFRLDKGGFSGSLGLGTDYQMFTPRSESIGLPKPVSIESIRPERCGTSSPAGQQKS